MDDLKDRLETLPPEKRALLALLLKKKGGAPPAGANESAPRERRGAGGESSVRRCPPSFAQQRLWFLQQLQPESRLYNLPYALRLSGALDVRALERALDALRERHEALRTTFVSEGGRPLQVVAPHAHARLPLEDLSALGERERELEARRRADEEARRPFDLGAGPLLRASVLRLGVEEHVLLLTMHHIVSDGWSFEVFVRELTQLYAAFRAGRPSPLPPLSVQYADYAARQRERLSGDVLERQLEYWRERLSGAPELLELPADRPRPAAQSFEGATQSFDVPSDVTERLFALGRREGATPFMTLLAAFKVLLSRYSRQRDIVVGTPVAGRTSVDTEGLIGLFVNTLALRTDLSDDPPFRALLARVREVTLGAYTHQDLPFEMLVDELRLSRSLSHTPVFNVVFTLRSGAQGAAAADLSGLKVMPLDTGGNTSKYDLLLEASETAAGLRCSLEYNTDVFEAATVTKMSEHFQTLLNGIVADPDRPASRLPLLGEAERRALLSRMNRRDLSKPDASAALHRLFEQQAARTPDAVAVVFEDEEMTYAELNAKADRLAARLRRLGVGPETKVGLLLERSAGMVVAILGVLKAGAAYVPLEPAYPEERLRYVVEDASLRVVIASPGQGQRAAGLGVESVLSADSPGEEEEDGRANGVEGVGVGVGADNLCYVIYTSGSTGRPKGVMVTHGNVARLFRVTSPLFSFSPEDAWTLFHSYAFDFSVWELWGALLHGGRLVVVPYWVSRSPDSFRRLLAQRGVTVLSQTPSAFRQLVAEDERAGEGAEPLALRAVVFGGEALEPASLRPWVARHGDAHPKLINMYGITETTVHVTYSEVTEADVEGGGVSRIGEGLGDLSVYVLDDRGEVVGAGMAGEMYVGGEGVARGYLNRPALTAERFVPDPFSGEPGARLYRTGDLARVRADGGLEYLGRIDQQVKVRGHRIELGEIEAALLSIHGVREAAVEVREDAKGEKRLVAYVVWNEGAEESATELRRLLKERLPDYMVPGHFVSLDEMPLTQNGKLDRRALPEPERGGDRGNSYVAPRTAVEETLCDIWSEVLGVERVGVEDNFFELGGDSLVSVQVLVKARERGLSFSLEQLFKHQTVGELARFTEASGETADARAGLRSFALISEKTRERLPDDVEDAYPLTALQMGMLFHSEYSPGLNAYHNVNSYHLRLRFDAAAFGAAVKELSAAHEVLRTSFDLASFEQPLQLVHRGVSAPLSVEDLSRLSEAEQEEEIKSWLAAEAARRFNWSEPPLWRCHVHLRGDDSFQFSVTHHHAILDGWSVASLLTELFNRYLRLSKGEAAHAPAPPATKFREYVAQEQGALRSEEAREFWTSKLQGVTAGELPRSSQRGAVNARHTRHRAVAVPAEVSDGLKELARLAGVPVKSVLLAAHLRVLGLLTGQEEVLTGVVWHGRPESRDGERVLGLFLNTLPFNLSLRGGTWAELAAQTFSAERETLPHRHYPGAQVQRDAGGRPLFETLFNFTHFRVYNDIKEDGRINVLGEMAVGETNYDLEVTFALNPITSQVELTLNCAASRFGEGEAEALADYYLNALAVMAREPFGRYETAPLLSARERRRMLQEWNDTRADFDPPFCLHELFEQQAARTPHSVAVVFEDEEVTYAELDARANRLAARLRRAGVGPESLVGLLLERSVGMVVAVLGVLKAGGAYVPLDTSYPDERLRYVVEDASLAAVLTEEGQERRAEALGVRSMLVVDALVEEGVAEDEGGAEIKSEVGADNLCYVIYTSGSTGRPKGVMVTHGSICNHMRWMREEFSFTPEDVVLQKTPFGFDASVWEFYAPLLSGGRLVMARPGGHQEPGYLLGEVERQGVTTLQAVPTMLQMLADERGRGGRSRLAECSSLRRVFSGGEALPRELAARLVEEVEGARLFNLYGPTEATIDTLWCECMPGRIAGGVPLGRPVANTRAYVLDRRMEPVPAGVVGELYLGGAALARGYLNRPALTAERFVPDPFSGEAGARLYRTGDAVRHGAGGQVEFVGRVDNQVKVRGYRVEPGEIEAALRRHEAVREAVVVVREDERGEKRLAAYVAGEAAAGVSAEEWRAHLRRSLPEQMIPAFFVALPRLPQTPNGKLDRRALPAPEPARGEACETFDAPRDLLELQLAQIWEEVLGVRPVGVRDSFFDLGGDSLLSVRLMARVEQATGRRLPLQVLIGGGTVESLASLLREQGASATPRTLVKLHAGGDAPPLFCVHPVGGGVMSYLELARRVGASGRPVYGLQARGLEGEQPPSTEFVEMAARYVEELRAVQPAGPYHLAGWSLGGVIAFEMARQLLARGETVAPLALFDSRIPAADERAADEDEARLLADFAHDLGLPLSALGVAREEFVMLDEGERLGFVLERAKAAGLVPAYVTREPAERLFEVYRANRRALTSYDPRPAPCRVLLFKAAERAESEDAAGVVSWDELAEMGVETCQAGGDHYTMLRAPHVEALAGRLVARLAAGKRVSG